MKRCHGNIMGNGKKRKDVMGNGKETKVNMGKQKVNMGNGIEAKS
jgi:hypothetical protein